MDEIKVIECRDRTIYTGTPEQLLEAGVLTPELMLPVGKSMATFYDGQRVKQGGRLADGRRAVEDEKYVRIQRRSTGILAVFKGRRREVDALSAMTAETVAEYSALMTRMKQPGALRVEVSPKLDSRASRQAPAAPVPCTLQKALETIAAAITAVDPALRECIAGILSSLTRQPDQAGLIAPLLVKLCADGRAGRSPGE